MSESPLTLCCKQSESEQYICKWTRVLSEVLEFICIGWPNQCKSKLNPFFTKHNERTVLNNYILWGSRVVVPFQGRKSVLAELHAGHSDVLSSAAIRDVESGTEIECSSLFQDLTFLVYVFF